MQPFILIFTLSATYFLAAPRRFDFFSIAFLSSSIYFLPGLLGSVGVRRLGRMSDINSDTYISISLVLALLTISAMMWDRGTCRPKNYARKFYKVDLFFILSLGILVGVYFTNSEWSEIFSPGKPHYGRSHSFLVPIVVLGLTISFASKFYTGLLFFIALSALDIYAGNRETAAFSLLACAALIGTSSRSKPLVTEHYWFILVAAAILFTLLSYKGVYVAVVAGRFDLVTEWLTSPDYYLLSVSGLESFVTLDILNSVLSGHTSYSENFLTNLLAAALPFGDIIVPVRPESVSHYISRTFYSDLDFGVAGNIWADAHVLGGWLMFSFLALLYAISPIVLNVLLINARTGFFAATVSIIGVLMLFYFHRSGLEFGVTLLFRYVNIYFAVYLLARLFRALVKKQGW